MLRIQQKYHGANKKLYGSPTTNKTVVTLHPIRISILRKIAQGLQIAILRY